MQGTEKQVKWANDIKAKIEEQAEAFRARAKNESAHKVIDFILSIDSASFWIDYRDNDFSNLLHNLATCGLRIKGLDFADNAKMDPKTGEITLGKISH